MASIAPLASHRRVYRVGDLRVDAGQASVRRGEELLHVQGLSFDLLVLLMEAAPNLVTQEEILARVWNGLVVTPETLSQRIKLLRAALGDDPRAPRYIEVVRGRGCRLVADVALLADEPEQGVVAPAAVILPAAPRVGRRAWSALLAVTGIVLLLMLGLGWQRVVEQPTAEQTAAGAAQSPRSVAVLPFETSSHSPDDATLVLGIAETLLHQLAISAELRVIARESSFALNADTRKDIRETGRRLRADNLITGSVLREGDRLRITTHLLDAASGTQLWSRQFDRPQGDLFALQDEIAAEVAQALKLSIEQRSQVSSIGSGTRNMQAWLAYQRGRTLLAMRSKASLLAAVTEFERARHEDPRFVAAIVALAEARILDAMSAESEFWANSQPVMNATAATEIRQLIAAALEIDPRYGEAYSARAWMQTDPDLALADARRGVVLAPNDATAVRRLAQLVYAKPARNALRYSRADKEESLRLLQRAEALDPLSPLTQLLLARGHLFSFGDATRALAIAQRLTMEHPDFHPGWVQLGEVHWCCRGEFAKAISALEHARQLDPHAQWTRDYLSRAYLDIGDPIAAHAVIAGPEFANSGTHIALRVLAGRHAEAVERGLTTLSPQSSGLNFASINMAFYAELGAGKPAPLSAAQFERRAQQDGQMPSTNVLIGGYLMRTGREAEGRQRVQQAASVLRELAANQGRTELFLSKDLIRAHAFLSEMPAALAVMQRAASKGGLSDGWYLPMDPLLKPLHADPTYQRLMAEREAHVRAERREVERLRSLGQLPVYTKADPAS